MWTYFFLKQNKTKPGVVEKLPSGCRGGSPRHPDTRGCPRGPVAEAPGGARGRGSGQASCLPSPGQSSPRGESGSPRLAEGAHLLLPEVAELGPSAQVQKGVVEGHGRPPGGAPGGCGGYWLGSGGLPPREEGAPPRLCIFGNAGRPRVLPLGLRASGPRLWSHLLRGQRKPGEG